FSQGCPHQTDDHELRMAGGSPAPETTRTICDDFYLVIAGSFSVSTRMTHAVMNEVKAGAALGPWSPLGVRVFRWLWLAALFSDIGTWMHEVAAGWLMTELSTSRLMVALVQAATMGPVFLLGLPAGALADIIDRRRLIMFAQVWNL